MVFLLNFLWNMLWGRKCLSNKYRKCFPTFVTTFALYGGLNYIIFFFQFLVVMIFCLMFCWYRISCLYSGYVSALLYGMSEFLNIITVIILILLTLTAVSLSTVDDCIRCWHKLFYCCLWGKDGKFSFLKPKWYLGTSWLSYSIEL